MPETDDSPHEAYWFEGLESSNGTLFPDVLLDQVMAHLTGAEFKVLAYLVRRTMGLKRTADTISLEHICAGVRQRNGAILDAGTGLSKKTAIAALKGLQDKGVIVASKSKGSLPTGFSLRFKAHDGADDTASASGAPTPPTDPL